MYKDLHILNQDVTSLDAIKNSIKNILMTPRGSLPGKPRFGSDLYKVVFQPLDPLGEAITKNYVMEALNEFEDRIDVSKVLVRHDDAYNKIIIDIVFSYKDISAADIQGESLVSISVKM